MEFGYHQNSFQFPDDPEKSAVEATRDRIQWLDEAGFSIYSVQDHFWQLGGNGYHDEEFFDSYTLLPWAAGFTDSIRLTPLVACVHYRPPAYLGRIATTLDHLSDGRAVLGVGAGWHEAEYDAYGIDFPDAPTRIRQLRDAIELIKTMWTEQSPVSHDGRYYDTDGLYLNPKPVQDPHPPVMIGGGGEQLTLRVAAHHADSWNVVGNSPDSYAHKLDVLRDHCEEMGREYDDIEKTVAHAVLLRETADEAHAVYEQYQSGTEGGVSPRGDRGAAIGTPEDAIAFIEAFDDVGLDTFMIKAQKNDRRTVELFVDEVMPAF